MVYMRNIVLIGICVVALLVPLQMLTADAIQAPPDEELIALVESLDSESGSLKVLSTEEFSLFLAYARKHERTLFELMNLIYPVLDERNLRYKIYGETILESEKKYQLGRSKIRVILPFDSLISMEFGAAFSSKQHALDVFIEEPYSEDFYGFGKLHEETHFGFGEIRPNYFNDAFGMSAKRLFTFDVSHLHLYEAGKVAIHLKNFFKPKREKFKPITLQD